MAKSAVPERMVRKRAKGVEDGKRYARASLWCAGAYWAVFGIATIVIFLVEGCEPRSQPPAFGEKLIWFGWLIIGSLASIAGLVGLFAAVAALVKGGKQKITVVALLVNAPIAICLVVQLVVQAFME